ncbi:polyprenyl synthetase family protein [Bacillus sp. HMF5848]|uniref:polyprenyl synthetase family protein n=1 Tax=Bacillus sp. HMF5848 TaxID=2495421 RepID=UPI000F76E748|nr:farnesyl diphosphate synthase [Bacillus sp. HMF5848]RSK27791.1 polyprenyl synthetase family protein [Bacillus sp. HMF5848]
MPEPSMLMQEWKQQFELQLLQHIQTLQVPATLSEAMSYSLEAGGKRIRPLLTFATLHAFQKPIEWGMEVASAIEIIHTYSLIHDDLPCMDDDDLRRGKPTNHKVFGEAMAVLAGDGLLTYSFQLIAQATHLSAEKRVALIARLAQAAGPEGMVGGQAADMQGEGKSLPLEQLEYIHTHKTGSLLAYSVYAGAVIANATEEQIAWLDKYSYHVGLAFQIRDDILDIEGNEVQLGKRVGSDVANEKSTYPALLTLKGAYDKLHSHINEAKHCLTKAKINSVVLQHLCDMIASRKQ